MAGESVFEPEEIISVGEDSHVKLGFPVAIAIISNSESLQTEISGPKSKVH